MIEFRRTTNVFKTFFCYFQVCYQFEYQASQMSLKKITWQKRYRWWPLTKIITQVNELDVQTSGMSENKLTMREM